MARYLLTLSYMGTDFCGWQVQPNGVSVQSVLCKTAEKIFGEKINITGCSRTDSGVHAREFCCHFDAETDIPPEKIPDAFNNNFEREDIAVKACREVGDDFHARYSSKGKKYVYRILNSPRPNPFEEGRALLYKYPLDINEMKAAAGMLCGKFDFSAFCSAGSSVEDKVRTVSQCEVKKEGDIIEISVIADGFLYNMVRIIVGTLLKVGSGKLKKDEIPKIIASRSRENAGATAPPCGLYLWEVYY